MTANVTTSLIPVARIGDAVLCGIAGPFPLSKGNQGSFEVWQRGKSVSKKQSNPHRTGESKIVSCRSEGTEVTKIEKRRANTRGRMATSNRQQGENTNEIRKKRKGGKED